MDTVLPDLQNWNVPVLLLHVPQLQMCIRDRYSAFHFILDCMFSFLYQLDYESNEKETKEKAYFIKESKEQ